VRVRGVRTGTGGSAMRKKDLRSDDLGEGENENEIVRSRGVEGITVRKLHLKDAKLANTLEKG